MNLFLDILIFGGFIAFIEFKNSNNGYIFGVFVNSLENDSYNITVGNPLTEMGISVTPSALATHHNHSHDIFLIIYILSLGALLVSYYLQTGNYTDIQQLIVLLGTGLSNVLTGIVLFKVKDMNEFKQIKGLLILIQPLMGLKGNLEMTMASRMATLMNVREDMVSCDVICNEMKSDIILVQSQATIISLFTAFFAIISVSIEYSFDINNALILCAISLWTANTACLLLGNTFNVLIPQFMQLIKNGFLGIVISLIIVLSKKFGHDPDDFGTPVAASLGDLVTLVIMTILVLISFHWGISDSFRIDCLILIIILLVVEPFLIIYSYKNENTRQVLLYGWTPIIISSVISSFSGVIFTHSNNSYHKLATFQPLFNGFAGNCLALLASRISTSLHRMGPIGTINENFKTYVSPYYAFCSEDNSNSRTTTLLLLIVIPSQFLYILIIDAIQDDNNFSLTFPFTILYLSFSIIQIGLLLYFTYNLTHICWKFKYDPDMNVIPILTAIADLTGTLALFFTYYLLDIFGDVNAF